MMTAVTPMPASSGILNSSAKPIAPPRNSARSVAMAAISLTTHIAQTTGLGNCSRHISARLRPVTMPSLADSAWNSMAITLASSTTQSSCSHILPRPGRWWRNCQGPYRRSRQSRLVRQMLNTRAIPRAHPSAHARRRNRAFGQRSLFGHGIGGCRGHAVPALKCNRRLHSRIAAGLGMSMYKV